MPDFWKTCFLFNMTTHPTPSCSCGAPRTPGGLWDLAARRRRVLAKSFITIGPWLYPDQIFSPGSISNNQSLDLTIILTKKSSWGGGGVAEVWESLA